MGSSAVMLEKENMGQAFQTSGLLAALLYGTVSSAMTFCNKALSQTFSFNYPLFLLMIQMAVTQIGLIFMSRIGAFRYPKITLQGLKEHTFVSCMYCLNAALALASLQATSIPTYGVLKRAGPLYILLISAVGARLQSAERISKEGAGAGDVELGSRDEEEDVVEGKGAGAKAKGRDSEAGPGVVAGVVIIVGGTLMTGWSDVHLTTAALCMAMSSSVVQSLYVLLVEGKHKGGGVGAQYNYGQGVDPTLGLLAHNSLLSVPLLIATIMFLDLLGVEGTVGFVNAELYNQNLVATMCLATLLGCSLNYTMFLCIRANSALTTSLVGHAKTAVQTWLGFFVLALDVQATPQYVAGVVLNAIGGVLFTMAKHKQKQSKAQQGAWGWSWWWEHITASAKRKQTRSSLRAASRL